MKIAVLAVQGAFAEHIACIQEMGAEAVELRKQSDVLQSYDGLVLPGGESTVQGKLLKELGMFDLLREQIVSGLPVLATCAGLILLAENIQNDARRWFCTLPVTVERNAYGRQLGSFHTNAAFDGLGEVPMTFIRAPYVTAVREDVKVLATVEHRIVGVQYGKQLAVSFHPELDEDRRIYTHFFETI